jgi:transcriptional regulator with XRE-family HTH domain
MNQTTGTASHPGPALHAARIEQGLTLRELAARTGLPYSTLSKLENGKMAMTYDKLVRLAQGLGVDLGSLVTGGAAAGQAPPAVGRRSVARAGKWLNASSERYRHHYPAADLLGKMMVPIIIEVTADNVKSLGGLVRHTGEEYLYVLRGAMELHSDIYAPLPLNAGDSVYFDSGMAHGYIKTSAEPCEVLSVCAGPGMQRVAESAGQSWDLVAPDGARPTETNSVSDIET